MDQHLNFDFEKFGIGITPADINNDLDKHKQIFIDKHKRESNPFPVIAFPTQIQEIIKATNTSLNYPVDFIGASILYGVALAIGNTCCVEVKKGWKETACLYLALVGRAGTNKSHPLSFALRPFEEKDTENYKIYECKMKEFKQANSFSKKEKNQHSATDLSKPIWNKFLISDFTPEALAEVHKFNNRGVGVYVDELAGWLKNFNRYHKGSEQEFWISSWSGKQINIDRKTGESIFIPKPFIPVIGTIQNGILVEMCRDGRSKNGFIDRILFVIPDELKKHCWSDLELDDSIPTQWQNIINRIIDLPLDLSKDFTPKPNVLHFSNEAKEALKIWQYNNTNLCNSAGEEALASIYSKLEVYVVRLALIFEVMSWACHQSKKDNISLQSVKDAILLIEYFRKTAVKAHSIVNNYNPIDNLPLDKLSLYEALPDRFKTVEGQLIADNCNVSTRTFKRFLAEKEFFEKISWGEYAKKL